MSSERVRPRQLQKLYDLLKSQPHASVQEVFLALRGHDINRGNRDAMQKISWTITRFNRWGGAQIVRGPAAYTYKLIEE